jgi:hypothetical protein
MDSKEMTYCQLPSAAKHQESAADYLTDTTKSYWNVHAP